MDPGFPTQAHCQEPPWDSDPHIPVQHSLAAPAVTQVAQPTTPEGARHKLWQCPCGI